MPHSDPDVHREYHKRYREAHKTEASAYRRQWYREHKHEVAEANKMRVVRNMSVIDDFKRGKPCVDCGGVFPLPAMHLDHVRGDKLYSVAAMKTSSEKKIRAEIAKCEIRCANCHAVRTWGHLPRFNRIEVAI